MSRSLIGAPGGFVGVTAFPTALDASGLPCTICSRTVGPDGWVRFATAEPVCSSCLQDPWSDDREAGRRVARQLDGIAEAADMVIY